MEFAGLSNLGNRQFRETVALPSVTTTPVLASGLTDPWQLNSANSASSLIFVDAGVQGYQDLVAGVKPGTEVYVLDPSQDAIAQISQVLSGRTGIASLQILSHGAMGALHLGQDWLTAEGLDRYASQLQAWSSAFTDDGDILLLGCNVGAGELGQAFLQRLSQLTGADIAASNNLTGATNLGGDWVLEVNTGEIGAAIALQAAALENYYGTLADVDLISVVPPSQVSNASGITTTPSRMSGNGRFVVFTSTADNLVANDANGSEDVFLYDRVTNTTTLVSRTSTGASGNAASLNPVISRDGNYVAFVSFASNLTAGDTNQINDIFVWERSTQTITLISQGIGGIGNQASDSPVISNDGSRIAFTSRATNLVTASTNGQQQVFLRDWRATTPTTLLISQRTSGPAGSGLSTTPSISGDGRFVAFASDASNLVTGDVNSVRDVFVRDTQGTGNTFIVSLSDDNQIGNASSFNPVISNDGTFVAFVSNATNLALDNLTNPGITDGNGVADVFVRDFNFGTTTLISINQTKTATGQGTGSLFESSGAGNPVISFDGNYIAFTSTSNDLVANDTNNAQDVFLRDWKNAASATILVSRNGNLNGSANAASFTPVISDDGSFVAFASDASNLLPVGTPDANGVQDVFLWTRATNQAQVVSRNTSGTLGNGASLNPAIGTDAGVVYVAFTSNAQNLALAPDTDLNGQPDLFLGNLTAGTTTLVSKRDTGLPQPTTATGTSGTNPGSSVSANGRYVVFTSTVSNLVGNDTNGAIQDVFWRDRQTNTTRLVSRRNTSSGSANQTSASPIISADGRYVTFVSAATDLVALDSNVRQDIFTWDSQTDSMILVSRVASGDGGNGDSVNPVMSSDGRYIAFISTATNLVAGDTNNAADIFIWDRTTDAIALVSRTTAGVIGNAGASSLSMSNDGSVIAFVSDATNLTPGDTNGRSDVFVWQRQGTISQATVTLVSRNTAGTLGNDAAYNPVVSGDGKYIAFVSTATNLAGSDGNGVQDVFVHEIATGKTELVSVNAGGTASGSVTGVTRPFGATSPSISTDGQFIAFASDAIDLVANDSNGVRDVFVWNRATGRNTLMSVNSTGTGSGNAATPDAFAIPGGSFNPIISGDGGAVVFTSYSSNLVANDTNNQQDVFARIVTKPTVTLVSRNQTGDPGNNISGTPALSQDGSYVVFTSSAGNLVAGDFNGSADVFGDPLAPTPPIVSFGTVPVSVAEGNNPAQTTPYNFAVTLSKPSTETITVPYTVTDVTTTAGTDYVIPTVTTLTFLPGETTKTIAIAIQGDLRIEPDETFTVILGTPVNALTGVTTQATGTILNDDRIPTLTLTGVSQLENAGAMVFAVNLSQPTGDDVVVQYRTIDGTATTTDNDYTAVNSTLTIAPGSTSAQITVNVTGDTKLESDETFTLQLSSVVGAEVAVGSTSVTGTIQNDDNPPTITVGNATLNEGNAGDTAFVFTVNLSEVSGQPVTVNYTTVDGTATVANNDYTASSGTLTIAPGSTTSNVTVNVKGDTKFEPTEAFNLQFSNPVGATISGGGTAIGTITNDDTTPSLSITDVSRLEGNSGTTDFVFAVTSSQAIDQDIVIDYATIDGTATAGSDYTAATGKVTIVAGTTSSLVTVQAIGDVFSEVNETFTLQLATPTLGTFAKSAGIGTIQNDDQAISFSQSNFSIVEGNSGTRNLVFTVNLSQANTQPVTVNYSTADGTATLANSDYVAASGTLTFAPSVTSQTITVQVNGDSQFERDETFTLTLTNPANATLGATTIATGTITNDDIAPTLSITDVSRVEGNSGTTDFVFGVTSSFVIDQDIVVDYSTADGTATAGTDYTATTGKVTIVAGTTSSLITVSGTGDTTPELNETFTVQLATPTVGTFTKSAGIGTIQNDDTLITLASPSVTQPEGNTGSQNVVFTVNLSQASVLPVTVNYSTADGTATIANSDYVAANGTLTFAPNTTSQSITVQVNGDTQFERDETFTLNLATPTNATLGTTATSTITLTNDDIAPTLSIADVSRAEGNSGTTDFVFAVTSSAAIDQDIVIDYITDAGTATADIDYTSATGKVTITAGTTSRLITLTAIGDTIPEPNETFIVQLINATIGTFTKSAGIGTIQNDDTLITLAPPSVSRLEGNTGSQNVVFTVNLSQASVLPVTVNYSTADGTATIANSDYVAANGTLTFAPNTTSQSITVQVNGDTQFERDETFTLDLATPTNATLGTTATSTITLTNDDIAPTLSIADVSQAEGNSGTTDFVFAVTSSAAIDQAIVVDYSTVPGTATAGTDYTTATGKVTIAAGTTSSLITISGIGDTTPESNETFTVQLATPTIGTLTKSAGIGTIQNDDTLITLAPPSVTVAEGNSGTQNVVFTVNLSQASVLPVTVNYSTTDGTATTANADYLAASGILTFAPNTTSQSITVQVTGDTKFEPDETFTLNLAAPTNGTLGTTTSSTVTLTNDDLPPTLSIADVSQAEGNSGTTDFVFAVTSSAVIDQAIVVDYSTVPGTATAGTDYTTATGKVTIAAGTTSSLITISGIGDTTPESNETFTVQLATPTIGTLTKSAGIGTIQNDDTLITLAPPSVTVAEGNTGSQNVVFTVNLSQASVQPVTVNYSTTDGTATTANADYVAASGILTFAPNTTSQSITVQVTGDTKFEPDETFTLNLAAPTNGTLGTTTSSTVTLTNDDLPPTLSIADVSRVEGNSGTTDFVFAVTSSAAIDQAIVVDYSTIEGTATAGTDYTTATGKVTIAAGTTSSLITISGIGDTTAEPNETFTVQLTNPTLGTFTKSAGIGTIQNDDTLITLAQPSVTRPEGNSGSQNVVFTVNLSQANLQPVTVNYSTTDGTATTANADYIAASGTLTFAPGITSQALTVQVNGDTQFERDETFTLNLTTPINAALGTTASSTITLTNDDLPPTLSIADVSRAEGNSGTTDFVFAVTSSAAIDQAIVVDYNTANGTATEGTDYTAATGKVTIAAGTTSSLVTISGIGDTTPESNETFTVQLTNPTIGTLTKSAGIGTIQNDDTLITLAQPSVTRPEGNSGSQNVVFTVNLSQASVLPVTVNYSTADGTATIANSDYVAANGTLTFAPNTTSQSITVQVNGDTQFERDETFTLDLATPTNATLGTTASSTITLTNDDTAPTLSIADVSRIEGNSGTTDFVFAVTSSAAIDQAIVVDYSTVPGTATAGTDYTTATGKVTIAAGTTSSLITISGIGDTTPESNETFTVQLATPTIGTFTKSAGSGTIQNDDTVINFSQPTVSVTEGSSGKKDLVFGVTLSQPNSLPVTVNYRTADGTSATASQNATIADQDYDGVTPGTITFAPNTTLQTITLKVNGDTKVEADESFTLRLETPTNGVLGTTAIATGTILNDDALIVPIVSIVPTTATLSEGNTGTSPYSFAITLSQATTQPVTVTYNTTNGTAVSGQDYVAVAATPVTFAPGETRKVITVDVIGDNINEPNETFNVNLSSPTGATLSSTSSAIGTIANDDPLPLIVFSGTSQLEGNTGTTDFRFDFSLSTPSAQVITIGYATEDGTATVADGDYQPLAGILTIAPGQTTQSITVKVNGDTQFEANETFSLALLNPSGVTIGNAKATATITNDDAQPILPTVSITPLDSNKLEGNSGTTDFTFAVNLSQASTQPITLVYNTANGTANAGSDYQAITNARLTFAPNETSKLITVKVTGDNQVESDETFVVNLSGATGATIATGSATGTIRDEDTPGFGSSRANQRSVDLLWRNTRTGENAIWLMNDTPQSRVASIQSTVDPNWIVVDSVDINRDGYLDLILRNTRTGDNGIWYLQNTTLVSGATFASLPDVNWQIDGVADFNSDGKYDLLWRNTRTGVNAIWLMDGATVLNSFFIPTLDPNWSVAGVGDFSGDTNPDILWRNYRTGENAIWVMKGGNIAASISLATLPDTNWAIAGVADFTNDRNLDILWRNTQTGENALWFLKGTTLISGAGLPTLSDRNFVIEAVTDFNQDGYSDLLWRNSRTGENLLWYMEFGRFGASYYLQTVNDPTWVIEKAGDFNGDRKPDILWRNTRTGDIATWFLDGTTVGRTLGIRSEPDLGATIVGTGDFNGDGFNDILWRNPQTGKTSLWLMQDTTYLNTINLPDVVDPNTRVGGIADFNGDGNLDILWNNNRTGETFVWLMNGSIFGSRVNLDRPKNLDATIEGVGDFNNDRNVDILWNTARTGETFLWLMNGTTKASEISYGFSGDLNWQIEGIGNFNTDNSLDILWRNTRTGDTYIWLMNNAAFQQSVSVLQVPDLDWVIQGVGDLNGDPNPDIMWRNIRTGDTAIWFMQGPSYSLGFYAYLVSDLDWQIQGLADFNRVRS